MLTTHTTISLSFFSCSLSTFFDTLEESISYAIPALFVLYFDLVSFLVEGSLYYVQSMPFLNNELTEKG
jgi:hypothetical protein